MNAVPATSSVQRPNAFLPILVGGFAAGVLDLTAAFIIYGPGVPRVIAGGILGLKALQGGGRGLRSWRCTTVFHRDLRRRRILRNKP
jgi:hypothetical protein